MAPPASTSTTRAALHDLTERLATTPLLPHHHNQPASSPGGPLLPAAQERRFAAALAVVDDAIVAGGGPTGGWRAKEHGVFLRLWSEFRGEGGRADDDPVARVTGNLRLLDRAHVALRGRSEAEVMRHVEWYEHYLQLLAKKTLLTQALKTARGAAAVLAAAEEQVSAAQRPFAAEAGKTGQGSGGVSSQRPTGKEEKDPKRARTLRRLHVWRLRKEAEAVKAEEERRAQQLAAAEEARSAASIKRAALTRRLTRQRAVREEQLAVLRAEKERKEKEQKEEEELTVKRLPPVVLERRALAAVKAAKARFSELRRREEERDPGQRARRQRELLAAWRQEAAWRMVEDENGEKEEEEGDRLKDADAHCVRRHGGSVVEPSAAPAKQKPAPVAPPPPSTWPKPFMDLQFRDRARLRRPTAAFAQHAYTDEDLMALDRRRHAGAHFQARPPGFPPVVHL